MNHSEPATRLPEVFLPGGTVRVSDAAANLGTLVAKTGRCFRRGGAVVLLDRNDDGRQVLRLVKPAALPSAFEGVARLRKFKVSRNGEAVEVAATCTESAARLILHAEQFLDVIPPIHVVSTCPVLIERNDQLVQVTGYDRESGILAGGNSVPDVPLDQAKHLLDQLLTDFCFATPADRSRAMAAIITPALVFGGLLGGRAPVDLGEADKSQAGKGFRNKITAAIYGNTVTTVAQRKGGVGSFEETFNAALIRGAVFIAIDNMRGKIDSPAIESFLTEDIYMAREPYSGNIEIDPRRVVVMMTSNRAEITSDLANRSSCIRLLKQPEHYFFREYPEGDILDHVRANQEELLGAVFAIVRDWHAQGKPRSKETGHDFKRWVQTLDWIIQNLLNAAPIVEGHREAQIRMSNPALTWLRDVALEVIRENRTDEWLRAHHLLYMIIDADLEIPGTDDDPDLDDEPTRLKVLREMGKRLKKCFPEPEIEIDGIKIERQETTDERGHKLREYRFSCGSRIPRHSRHPPRAPEHFLEETVERRRERMLGPHAGNAGDDGECGKPVIESGCDQLVAGQMRITSGEDPESFSEPDNADDFRELNARLQEATALDAEDWVEI